MVVRVRGHYHTLPWIASPLEQEGGHHGHGHSHEQSEHVSHGSSDALQKGNGHVTVHDSNSSPTRYHVPTFREREEATTIELFYDLFFVANLSSFTNNHPIDDSQKVKSYIGFFALLWFNWLQVTLYDVRFAVDSVFERVAKALHLGVMIGFAVVGTQFDTSDTAAYKDVFQKFSLILMVSRVVLLIQYSSILLWIRQHKTLMMPIMIHIGLFAASAIVYLGITFSFHDNKKTAAYLMWYVWAVLEALVVFGTSSHWRTISFKRTNLNERCGLLSLIILGEGVIVLTKTFTYITYGNNYSSGVIGQIISSIVIIYLIYMLYFDQVDAKRFGTIRQQFWALAHFPFHICLVLLLEGVSRFITWRNALERVDDLFNQALAIFNSGNNTQEIANTIRNATGDLYKDISSNVDLTKYNITAYLAAYSNATSPDSDQAQEAAANILLTVSNAVLKYFKISGPAKKPTFDAAAAKSPDPVKDFGATLHVYDLVFGYLFIAAGLTLVLMALLILVAKRHKVMGDYAAVAVRAVFGVALACVSAIATDPDRQITYMSSAWMLPTIAITIVVVVLVDAVLGYVLPAPREEAEYAPHAHGGE